MLRGFLAGGFGLLCATVGQDPQAGIARYTFDMLYLWQGLDLVPVLVGIFAIPEIIDLAIRRSSIAGELPPGRISKGAFEGVKDTFRHFWLTIRCSLIGTFIGIMPGMGGAVAQWMAYGHATQSARTAEERKGFGAGDVRGVLGPGALSEAMKAMPTMASMKSSGEPNVSTSGRTIGIAIASAKAPTIAPTSDEASAAPSARPASPFFAMAWPSRMVAALEASPGTPNRIEVMSPVVATTACMPSRNANASTGCIA